MKESIEKWTDRFVLTAIEYGMFTTEHPTALRDKVRLIIAQCPNLRSECHGPRHWLRVLDNGLRILDKVNHLDTGKVKFTTRPYYEVMWLFALCHDCRRTHDGHYTEHGFAGAMALADVFRDIATKDVLELSARACCVHTIVDRPRSSPIFRIGTRGGLSSKSGLTVREAFAVGSCLDADRLDLPRVGIIPDPEYMYNPANLDFLEDDE